MKKETNWANAEPSLYKLSEKLWHLFREDLHSEPQLRRKWGGEYADGEVLMVANQVLGE